MNIINPQVISFSCKEVLNLRYMKILRFFMNCIGGWPHEAYGSSNIVSQLSRAYRCFLIVFTGMEEVSTVTYLKRHMQVDMGQTYLNVLMAGVCFQRLFLPFQKKFGSVIKQFTSEFHLIHHKHKTDFASRENDRVYKICLVISIVSTLQVVLVTILFNMMPLYKNFQEGLFTDHKNMNATFQHPVDYELPIDQYTTLHGYFTVFVFDWYIAYYVATAIVMYDLLIFTIIFHIWGHLNILIHDLRYFAVLNPEDSVKSLGAKQEEIFESLKDIVRHHQMIKGFMARMSEMFSVTLCFYLFFHQLSGCVLLLKCSSLDLPTLGRYGMVTSIIFQQLIQTSVIFELIGSQSDALANEVYSLPWERMDARNRRTVLMLLRNVQRPLALKAGGMVPVGVRTMSGIIRTSCSYFIMLRTFTQ